MDLSQLKIERQESTYAAPKRSLVPWIVLLLIAAGIWWFRSPLKRFFVEARLPKVEVAQAYKPDKRAQAVASGVSAGGYVVARVRAALSSDVPGRIVDMRVTEGTRVKAGDVVARLAFDEQASRVQVAESNVLVAEASLASQKARTESLRQAVTGLQASLENARADVLRADAEVDWATTELRRIDRLREQDLSNESEHDDKLRMARIAEAGLTASKAGVSTAEAALARGRSDVLAAEAAEREAQANIEQMRAQAQESRDALDKTYVRAPFDGVVVLKDAEVGEVVSPNSQGGSSRGSVATLVDLATLEAQVELPEVRIAAIRQGGTAQIYLDAYPDVAMPGKVARIWPTANRQKATVEVRVTFDKLDERIRPEMGVRVVFEDPEPTANDTPVAAAVEGVRIPERAFVQRPEGNGVFLLEGDRVRWVPVASFERAQGVVILPGNEIPDDGRVLVAPPSDLADGEQVLVR
ncbi:MAG: efflux RND transporter periplasmic adaptor subunit [Planctomycetes bacterium]|nr:efflux RND transporter periplasmic adaptor subunit [Planctomycetota bacterium]MCB9909850.1 efflux RND transporter periplasmic adaptor subunit [Planctomycetota bacterium]MCB9913401.1 efflux RND transporter periplasmic adaptor subunit [Planctomycetota bacterium]HPF12971.1 efflux RND transporter periplasmic adaptor subunit [Planctomycetota bacterium]HRV80348.1 efflux RND transporter periplasmic adaptor subunit [Planctomycetota bacterium]